MVVEYFKDELNDIIIGLKSSRHFKLLQYSNQFEFEYFKIIANKWNKSEIDHERVHLKLNIDLSDNSTSDKSKYQSEMMSNAWKISLAKDEFLHFYNRNEFINDTIDIDKFKELRNNLRIQNRSMIEPHVFTLNSTLDLEFNLYVLIR